MKIFTRVSSLFLCLIATIFLTDIHAQCGEDGVGGTVFRDFNFDGVQSGATSALLAETGYMGVTVNIYGSDGALMNTTTTDASGMWSVSGLPAGERVLVEYVPPASFYSGAPGANSNSELELIEVGKCALTSGITLPADYCQESPNLLASCISDKYQTVRGGGWTTGAWDITDNATLFMKKYGEEEIGMTPLTYYNETGNLFGVAYAKNTNQAFGASFIRGGGIVPSVVGKIFKYDISSNAVTTWADLPALGYSVGSPIDGAPADNGDFIGRTSLGDLDISSDESQLYVANVFSKNVLILPVNSDGSLNSGGIKEVVLPNPCGSDDYKAVSALGVHSSGRVYAAVTCHGPAIKDYKFVIYSFDPKAGDPTATIQEELVLDNLLERVALWNTFSWEDWPNKKTVALQLWMTDIEFRLNNDGSEVMYLGTRNRNIDQSIATPGSCNINAPVPIYSAQRPNTSGSWAVANLKFPTEYATTGSLAYQNGYSNLIAMYRDCNSNAQAKNSFGGFRAYPINGGAYTAQFRALQTAFSEVLMRFNNIWADAEFMCDPAPITIGNLVWYDVDMDGIRDPDEAPSSGVTVSLFKDINSNNTFDSGDKYIATTVTDGLGHYYFSDLLPNMKYLVVLNNANDFGPGGVIEGAVLTSSDVGNDHLDSDASLQDGVPAICFTTAWAGENNFTYDFGIIVSNPPELPPPGCYTLSSTSSPSVIGCIGEVAEPWELNVFNDPSPGSMVRFVSFPTKQTGTDMFTGGTTLATIVIANNMVSYTPVIGATEDSTWIYAIPDPTPPNIKCRPFSELLLRTRDCSVIPDLKLIKDVSTRTPTLNSTIIYTIKVINEGTLDATGVTVDEPLPTGLTVTNAVTAQGTYMSGVWTIGSLAIGDTATIDLSATVDEVGLFYNTAEVLTVNEGDKDSTPDNEEEKEDDMDRECISVPIEICPGESYNLSVSPEYTEVQWYLDGDTIPDATDNSYPASEGGLYTVSALYKGRPTESLCGFDLTIKSGLINPVIAATDSILCTGESTTLSISGGGDYLWSTGATSSSITVSPVVSGDYKVTVTVAGCDDEIEKSLNIEVDPVPTIYMFGPVESCKDSTLELSAIGGVDYSWSNGGAMADATFTPATSGPQDFTVTVTNEQGCESTQTLQVDIGEDCGPCIDIDIPIVEQICCFGNLPDTVTIVVSDPSIDSILVAILYEINEDPLTIYDDLDLYYVQSVPVVAGEADWIPFSFNNMFEGALADARDVYLYAGLLNPPIDPNCRPFDYQRILVERKPICPTSTTVTIK